MHATRSTLIAVVASLATTAQAKLLIYLPLNETSGTRATDYSGSNLHGTYVNGPQLQGSNGARLDGNNDYIQLPNNLLRNLGSLTASIEVNIREEQTGLYFIFGIGSTASSSGAGNGYILATGDPEYRVAVSPSNWESEAEVRTTSALPRNQWKTVTFTVQTAAQLLGLYDDGVYIGGQTNTAAITAPGLITRGNTANNYIGRSVYTQDKYLAGSVRNFRLYDNALSAPEIAKLHRPGFQQDEPLPGGGGGGGGGGGDAPEDRIVAALGSIDIPNIDNIRGNINLPVASGGLAIRWESSDTNVITANGQVTRPVGRDVVVILTAKTYK
ncbi:concanavalin A-like lectin/glucanase domain-containing protein [Lasiosphaeria hispida]|uniref:Concanavalin A-like lectin/glucanase domain-containing protein n=1 Tax=Lasiosphaeria hispida TaxID=260671 RepID=A0AAJ0HSI8_9PEZI|nr:concanavalin A-like lectin/glucanase domain-containing protein [Lasiosphaeria hispida]